IWDTLESSCRPCGIGLIEIIPVTSRQIIRFIIIKYRRGKLLNLAVPHLHSSQRIYAVHVADLCLVIQLSPGEMRIPFLWISCSQDTVVGYRLCSIGLGKRIDEITYVVA